MPKTLEIKNPLICPEKGEGIRALEFRERVIAAMERVKVKQSQTEERIVRRAYKDALGTLTLCPQCERENGKFSFAACSLHLQNTFAELQSKNLFIDMSEDLWTSWKFLCLNT